MAAPQGAQKYNAVIMDPDLDGRMKLRQSTASVWQFGKVHQSNDTREAMRFMQGDERCDVVFISYRIPDEEVGQFIKDAKESKQGQDAAFVMVMKSADQGNSDVAKRMLLGADGFLCEPYSVDNLVEITNLSARVRSERSVLRQQVALKVMYQDIVNIIDQAAEVKSSGFEPSRTMTKLRELTTTLNNLTTDSPELRETLMSEAFEKAEPPKFKEKKRYGGVSNRVKNRMEKKVVAKFEIGKKN